MRYELKIPLIFFFSWHYWDSGAVESISWGSLMTRSLFSSLIGASIHPRPINTSQSHFVHRSSWSPSLSFQYHSWIRDATMETSGWCFHCCIPNIIITVLKRQQQRKHIVLILENIWTIMKRQDDYLVLYPCKVCCFRGALEGSSPTPERGKPT